MVLDAEIPLKNRKILKEYLINKMAFWPIFISDSEFESIYDGVLNNHLKIIFGNLYSSPSGYRKDLSNQSRSLEIDWKVYKNLNLKIKDEILRCQKKNDMEPSDPASLVILNGLMYLLIPSMLTKDEIKLNLGYYFHTNFPNSTRLKTLKESIQIMSGLLTCDVIYFNLHKQARNFLQMAKDLFFLDICYDLNGYISVAYRGRKIYVRVINLGIDKKKIGITNQKHKS